jgi:hypothetical protein
VPGSVVHAVHALHVFHAGDLVVDLDGIGVAGKPVDDLLEEADLVGLADDDVEIQPFQDQVGGLRVGVVSAWPCRAPPDDGSRSYHDECARCSSRRVVHHPTSGGSQQRLPAIVSIAVMT